MLVTNERFDNIPVMSLQTGSELARVSREIIDPRQLKIIAFELEGRMLDQNPSLLLISDMREVGPLGIIIDSVDEIVSPSDVVKVKEVYELGFDLKDIKVTDDNRRRVGRVIGYTLESGNFVIQQIRVKRPLLQSFGDTELLIHRSQIVKVTNSEIIVKSPKIRKTEPIVEPVQQAFENPFRKKPEPQPDTADI